MRLRRTDLARAGYRPRTRPRRRYPFLDFEDEHEDDEAPFILRNIDEVSYKKTEDRGQTTEFRWMKIIEK